MVRYFIQDTDFLFKGKAVHKAWLKAVASEENRRLGDISVIFCSDAYLLDMNKKYLGHDYFTDIITFDYSEGELLSGDLFISVDTVRSNADRVIVHGLLHLIGYDDHSEEEFAAMKEKENYYLSKRALFF